MAPTAPTIVYSSAPASSVDVSKLSQSRFLLPDRKLPFRDAIGRVNINLVRASLATARESQPEEVCTKLRAWHRHCVRAVEARPDEEKLSLDNLFGDVHTDDEDSSEAICVPPATVKVKRRGMLPNTPESDGSDDDDEITADRAHLIRCQEQRRAGRKRKRTTPDTPKSARKPAAAAAAGEVDESGSHASSEREEEGVYEVEAILEEDAKGGRGFLIRWLGYAPKHDSWEPEHHLNAELVAAFRRERAHATSHTGDDYMAGRRRMLWCASCTKHMPSDSFSANMRRVAPAQRSCLNHHYKTHPATLLTAHVTPDRRRAQRHGYAAVTPGSPRPPPPPPHKDRSLSSRPPSRDVPAIARALASRHASLATSPVARLFPDA